MRTVTCRNCGAPNPSGSKFCNRCGDSLAPHTHQICPNCQTPNPIDLLYCDNCGTRLSTRKLPEDSPQPSQGEQSSGRPKPFSLPARPPGQTAHLDPSGTLPDWLKTGESTHADKGGEPEQDSVEAAREQGEEWQDEEAPTLNDASGSHSPSDDLPLWLMNDDNARAEIFHREKSTDELFQTAGNQKQRGGRPETEPLEKPEKETPNSRLSDREAEQSETAGNTPGDQIPDWLEQLEEDEEPEKSKSIHQEWLAELEMEDEVQQRGTGELPEEEFSNWMADLSHEEDSFPSTDIPAEAEGVEALPQTERPERSQDAEVLPDWLSDLDTTENEGDETAQEVDLPGWLVEDQPGPAAGEEAGDELPDWLSGLEQEDEASTARRQPVEEGEEIPDWLSGLEGAGDQREEESPDWFEELSEVVPSSATPSESDEVPDWLLGLEAGEKSGAEPIAEAEVSDWLQDREEEPAPPLDTPGEDNGWLSSLDDGEEEGNVPEWLEQTEGAQFQPQTPPVPSPETFETPPLPDTVEEDDFADWLADIETDTSEEETETVEGFPDWLSGLDTDDETPDSAEAGAEVPGWLTGQEGMGESSAWAIDEEEEGEDEAIAPAEGMPDWLQDMAAEAGVFSEIGDGDEEMEDFFSSLEGEDLADWLADVPEEGTGQPAEREPILPPPQPAAQDRAEEPVFDDLDFGEWEESFEQDEEILDIFAEADTAYREEMPDYLRDQVTDSVTPEMFSQDELPDWLSDVMLDLEAEDDLSLPEPEESQPSLPPVPSVDLSTVPEQLAGEELPAWLDDSMRPSGEAAEPTPMAEIPEWLRPGSEPASRDLDDETFSLETEGEWNDILDEMAPFRAPTEQLSEADIPDWLRALKPQELQAKSTEPVTEVAPETSGPLAGLRGVIHPAPIVTELRISEYVPPIPTSLEQQQQVALLRQLVRGEDQDVILVTPERAPTSPLLRTVLALLLLAAILVGLLAPNLLELTAAPIDEVVAVQDQISQAAGQPVLVAFEYSPALAGALQGQTEMLLTELAANGSPVLITSQSATGLALARQTAARVEGLESSILGYVPGGAVGLRRLGRCLEAGAVCETITGAPLGDDVRLALDEVALIVIFTGERDNLVDWIEQVEAPTIVPLIAGVTQAVAPVAAPYYESGQLKGVLAGFSAVTAYQEEAEDTFEALAFAHWLVFAALLLGNLYYLFTGQLRSRRRKVS